MLEINATAIAVVINFLILAYLLNYFMYGPVRKLLEERKSHIDTTLSEADAKMSSAKAFMEEGREAIRSANKTAKELMDQAANAAGKIKKDMLSQSQKELDAQKERAKLEIKQYKADAKKSLVDEAAKLSVVIAEKIIMKKIDKKSQKAIVGNFIERIKN
jgi:F-type H+-transporting ATPase subunit b